MRDVEEKTKLEIQKGVNSAQNNENIDLLVIKGTTQVSGPDKQ